ncbi:MAG: hypothetical protein COV67_11190 [Nitrospinae bacterium CG11_big_fil_rev_8_21_14_0_20_56_8]|nr:MAG: hypothetical protein COV67_11190 [Nitrospinae bacterium CG11_big_fil_rev_8_21_14_0_20_56_8]
MLVTLISFVHIFSLVFWIGSILFFSFLAAPAVFKALDREQAGEVVGILFPRYYKIGYVCGILTLITLILGSEMMREIKMLLLMVMLVATFFAGLVINPNARKLKARLKEPLSPTEREALEEKFRRTHSLAVKLNGLVLAAGLVFLWFTAEGLSL